jgi:hypothetical protein
VTYNRPDCLKRLLASLSLATYNDNPPDLVISIDYSDIYQQEMNGIAEQFIWNGNKIVRIQDTNLGLKQHIFQCAEISKDYDSIIMLEDDLVVSSGFYEYAIKALRATSNQESVAGISLYSNTFNESAMLPFEPLSGKGDFYQMQVPCSWGQIWSRSQWEDFKSWYDKLFNEADYGLLPTGIKDWSETSWKKPYFLYLLKKNKYIAYPYVSYSMNMNAPGTNIKTSDFKFLNSLANSCPERILQWDSNAPKYEMSYMLENEFFDKKIPELKHFDYQIDLFGSRLHLCNDDQYLLTMLPCQNEKLSFGLELKPIEMNILMNVKGNDIKLVRKRDILTKNLPKKIIDFYYPIPMWYYAYFQVPIHERLKETFHSFFNRLTKSKS